MKKSILITISFSMCFLFPPLKAGTCPYEKEIEKFCHQTEGLLELQEDSTLLNLSGSINIAPTTRSYNAAVALFPKDPIRALQILKTALKPGAKALFIFYPKDASFYEISKEPYIATSIEDFRQEIRNLEFSICHFELNQHFAYFDDAVKLAEFTNKYLHFSKLDLPSYAFLENQIYIPSKLIVAVLKIPSEDEHY